VDNAVDRAVRRDTWRRWWEQGDWDRLAPAVISHVRPVIINLRDDFDMVDDIASRTVIRCWEQKSVPTDPGGFAVTVAANLARDYYKTPWNQKHRRLSIDSLDSDSVLDNSPDPLQHLVDLDTEAHLVSCANRVRRKIGALAPMYRNVLRLRFIKGLSVAETAEHLHITEGLVKMRTVRGRRMVL